jgi:hypothetical protein
MKGMIELQDYSSNQEIKGIKYNGCEEGIKD